MIPQARALCSATLLLAITATPPAFASDHIDYPEDRRSPGDVGDPVTDITAMFAFTSPRNPDNLVLALSVNLQATALSRFSDQAEYIFRVRRVSASPDTKIFTPDSKEHRIVCTFEPGVEAFQDTMRCKADGYNIYSPFNEKKGGYNVETQQNDPNFSIFAGLTKDPFFFDGRVVVTALSGAKVAPENPVNPLGQLNVLNIVVEVNTANVFGPGSSLFAVVGETRRKQGKQ